ncbi:MULTISPECIES: hypothetical protein [Bifidobacterium]|uniref:hypothetical protein n=1 Tax=Bifidobacterium TaxID=1678 RepID=UPI0015E28FE6|nr:MULTISPECIES: hypothetical protein [Bifidobacterium]
MSAPTRQQRLRGAQAGLDLRLITTWRRHTVETRMSAPPATGHQPERRSRRCGTWQSGM